MLLRFHLLILVAVTAASAVLDTRGGISPLDLDLIGEAGLELLSGRWRLAFSDATVQAGPIQLLLWGLVIRGAQAIGSSREIVFSVFAQTSVVVAAAAAFRLPTPSRPGTTTVRAVALALVLVLGVTWRAYASGHPEEVWVGVLWLVAAAGARDERSILAGLLIGISAGIKLWGALGVCLLAATSSGRRFVTAAATAAATSILLYAPFLVFGNVHTFDYTWPISGSSVLSALGFAGDLSWSWRVAQATMVVFIGVLLTRRSRARWSLVWLVPAQVIALRLLLDPANLEYYWLPVTILLMAGAVASWPGASCPARIALAGPPYALVVALTGSRLILVWLPFALIVFVSMAVEGAPSLRRPYPNGRIT